MCLDSASLNEKMLQYRALSMAFSYPDGEFFICFPHLSAESDHLKREYDRLFRAREIWLYGAEYTNTDSCQISQVLADIAAFYQAFGVETNKDRPDLLSSELEFMYLLLFKERYALDTKISEADEKFHICREAERKFFLEHLFPAGEKIAQAILSQAQHEFYLDSAEQLLQFFKEEKQRFLEEKPASPG